MATAYQSKKKAAKGIDSSGMSSAPVGALSLPKIGAADHTRPPPSNGQHAPHAAADCLPKLKSKNEDSRVSSSQPSTRRGDKSHTGGAQPPDSGAAAAALGAIPSLPSVSPRIADAATALTTKILNSIGTSNSDIDDLLSAAATARRASSAKHRDKSTKKKKKHKDGPPGPDSTTSAVSNRTVVALITAKPPASDSDDYEDDDYERSRTPSAPVAAAAVATPTPLPVTSASSTDVPSASVPVKRRGPSVQAASQLRDANAQLSCEIGEELDSSFHTPPFSPSIAAQAAYARTRPLNVTHAEVEEEASAQLHATALSPHAIRPPPDLDTSITDDLHVALPDEHTAAATEEEDDEESIHTLLLSSPASGASRHPTSIHPPTPSAAAAAASKAKAIKKKSTTAAPPPPKPLSMKGAPTPTSAASGGGKKKMPHVSTPSHKASNKGAPPQPTPPEEDAYADNDWRNQTTAFPLDKGVAVGLQKQLDAAASVSDLPAEMIRFTLRPETIQQLYTHHAKRVPPPTNNIFNTTLEFSRSQRIGGGSHASDADGAAGSLAAETEWVPVFSTTLNPTHSSTLAGNAGVAFAAAAHDSVFTVDRESLGADPNESLLVRLWNTVYSTGGDEATDDSPNTSLNRTLLAEFHTSVSDFAAQSKAGDVGLDRTQPLKAAVASEVHEPRLGAVAPRSAMKPSSGGSRLSSPHPPSKPRVRFFDEVEIFRLSAPLDRTLPSGLTLGSTLELEEKHSAPPSASEDAYEELATLFVADQIFQRRGRSSAGTQRTTVATTAPSQANKKPAAGLKNVSPPTFVRLHAQASDLPKMAFHGSANPVFEILIFFGGAWQKPLYRSECQFATLHPSFKPFVLCAPQSDALLDAPVVLKLVHFADQPSDDADTIGQCLCTLRALIPTGDAAATPPRSFVLTHPAKQKLSSKRTQCGQLTLHFLPPATPSAATSRRGSAQSQLQSSPASASTATATATAASSSSSSSSSSSAPTSTAASNARRKSNGPPVHSGRPSSKQHG